MNGPHQVLWPQLTKLLNFFAYNRLWSICIHGTKNEDFLHTNHTQTEDKLAHAICWNPVKKTLWGPLLRTLHWEHIGNSHVIVIFEHNVLGTHLYIEIESLPPPLLTPPTDCLPQENQLGLRKSDLRSAVLELLSLAIFVTIVGIVYRMLGTRDMNCGDTVWSLKTEWK